MILKDLINKSYYGTIGHVSKEKDLEILNQYILHNFEILKEYKNIIVATNYSFSFFSSSNLQDKNKELWLKYFPNAKSSTLNNFKRIKIVSRMRSADFSLKSQRIAIITSSGRLEYKKSLWSKSKIFIKLN